MKTARGVMRKRGMVSAVFHNKEHLLEAYQALIERSYSPAEIKLIMSTETLHSDFGRALDFSPGGNGFFDHPSSVSPAHDSIKEAGSAQDIASCGIAEDRALTYYNEISSGGVVIAIMPKGPTDRYTIGQYWRRSHAENIVGDDEDF